jgi:hypothetical protein
MMPVSMAAALLEVEVATVQGYIRRGILKEIVVGNDRKWIAVSASDVRAMRLKKLRQIRNLASPAEQILLEAAAKQTTIEYGADLMEPLGLHHEYARDRDLIGKALGRVSTNSYKTDARMLSVLAVRKDTGRPNAAFFRLAEYLGAKRIATSDERFFLRERRAVIEAYG